METKMNTTDIEIGMHVVAGKIGTEDFDRGTIIEIDGAKALVAWESGVRTWIEVAALDQE